MINYKWFANHGRKLHQVVHMQPKHTKHAVAHQSHAHSSVAQGHRHNSSHHIEQVRACLR